MSQSDEETGFGDMFPEPERPATPPPTIHTYTHPLLRPLLRATSDVTLTIQLVGSNPLWGHVLWNAAVSTADYFLRLESSSPGSVKGRSVLELGAGGGLPSLVAACCGAEKVCVTDYPEEALLDNLRHNVRENKRILAAARAEVDLEDVVQVQGHLWGKHPERLGAGYDILVLSDLIFNHSQHAALLVTCQALITPETGKAYVFHSHHLPQYYLRDLGFFTIAAERGWRIRRVVKEARGVMFEADQGDVRKRGTVWGWEMTFVGVGKGFWDPEEHSEGLKAILESV
ncbi:Protein N-terminal and lysine N-methyltransferase efm7 [Naganishia albida]|nr:Protein N-terminal and lysine N-methyltransferase efm7 [Naganishia albida]